MMLADGRHPRPVTAVRFRIGVLLHRWHRRLGAIAAAFLIWLAISGILINEAAVLHLDQVRVGWPWLMHWYGLQAEAPASGWFAGGHWLATVDDEATLDGRRLDPAVHAPVGMVDAGGILYVATPTSLVLLKADGTRIDELREPPLPVASIRRLGLIDQQVAIQDLDAYGSADGEDWTAVAPASVQWVQPQPLPDAQRTLVARLARPSLPLARILADAHSGRLFGRYGVGIINIVGLLAIMLAASGLWLWRRSRQRHRHSRSFH